VAGFLNHRRSPQAALVGLVWGGIVLGIITGVFMRHIMKSHLAR
jgi:hypothetical protein